MQWQRFLVTSLVLQLPGQFFPTVAMTKFLSDWCEGFIHHPAVLAKSFIFICQYGKTEVLQWPRQDNQPGENLLETVPNEGHQCRCHQVTTVRQRFSSQFPSSSKVRSMSSAPSQCGWLQKLEPGRHLRPCVRKILGCWCCCVTTARQPLWLRLRFAARMSKTCCNASIHNRSMTFSYIFHSLRFLLSFKGHFSYERVKEVAAAAFGLCCTAKSKQHLSHEQQMMIQAEWNQRSLSHGVTLPWPLSP